LAEHPAVELRGLCYGKIFDNEQVHAEILQLPRVTVVEKLGEFN